MLRQPPGDLHHLQVHDSLDVFLRQAVEDDDLVDAVEELGAERALEVALDVLAQLPLLRAQPVFAQEAQRAARLDERRADVRRHDQHGVAEVHHVALAVGQPAVLQDL